MYGFEPIPEHIQSNKRGIIFGNILFIPHSPLNKHIFLKKRLKMEFPNLGKHCKKQFCNRLGKELRNLKKTFFSANSLFVIVFRFHKFVDQFQTFCQFAVMVARKTRTTFSGEFRKFQKRLVSIQGHK